MTLAAEPYDLAIIGGGINGCGIARDAAGRGLKVLLCEQNDLGGATSASSTKLIHGGLRYLEHYEFRLVREALIEREVLLAAAPHIIWPLTFVLPHDSRLRPAWLIRLGLLLYDHLGGRKRLAGSRGLDLRRDPVGRPLKPELVKGFSYSDCWVEDSRLVILNALDARERGATVLPRTSCVAAVREQGAWTMSLQGRDGAKRSVRARALVNAAGPWVREVLGSVIGANRPGSVRLVKGSHIVVKRLYEGEQAYILQNDDRRIVFVIPYEREFSLIGTTDVPFDGDPAQVAIDRSETDYLIAATNRYLARPIGADEVVWSYAGVRPLYDDESAEASEVTRDYVFDIDRPGGEAPLLSIFGGKITTYRRLAEHALEKLLPLIGEGRPGWTAGAALPGGEIADADFEAFFADARSRWPWLPQPLCRRLARAYGTRMAAVLGKARALVDLGRDFGSGLSEAEVDYLRREEWAESADDILWRRSKLGLHLPRDGRDALAAWLANGARRDVPSDGARNRPAATPASAAQQGRA